MDSGKKSCLEQYSDPGFPSSWLSKWFDIIIPLHVSGECETKASQWQVRKIQSTKQSKIEKSYSFIQPLATWYQAKYYFIFDLNL